MCPMTSALPHFHQGLPGGHDRRDHPPEMHEKYLNIVLNETDRLTKLTNSLLMLNNLNTKGMLLDRTDFDINKVIRNTAASFEGTCKKRPLPSN